MSIEEKLTTIAENQQAVFDAGYNKGKAVAGGGSGDDTFWDTYQNNGERSNYNYAFYSAFWDDTNFKPKHNFRFSTANYVFYQCGVTDLVAILKREGITMDFSPCTVFSYAFYSSGLVTLPVINTTKASSLPNTFGQSTRLKSIEKLILKSDGSQTFTNTFTGLSSLEHMIVEGTIGKNGVILSSSSKLDKESLLSVLNALQDKTGDTSETWKITIGTTNKKKLTDAEVAIATDKNWQVV